MKIRGLKFQFMQVLETLDAVVDVGGVYDPSKDRYDHHQKGFEEVFGHGFCTKLSSAGLVYKVLYITFLSSLTMIRLSIDNGHIWFLLILRKFWIFALILRWWPEKCCINCYMSILCVHYCLMSMVMVPLYSWLMICKIMGLLGEKLFSGGKDATSTFKGWYGLFLGHDIGLYICCLCVWSIGIYGISHIFKVIIECQLAKNGRYRLSVLYVFLHTRVSYFLSFSYFLLFHFPWRSPLYLTTYNVSPPESSKDFSHHQKSNLKLYLFRNIKLQ